MRDQTVLINRLGAQHGHMIDEQNCLSRYEPCCLRARALATPAKLHARSQNPTAAAKLPVGGTWIRARFAEHTFDRSVQDVTFTDTERLTETISPPNHRGHMLSTDDLRNRHARDRNSSLTLTRHYPNGRRCSFRASGIKPFRQAAAARHARQRTKQPHCAVLQLKCVKNCCFNLNWS